MLLTEDKPIDLFIGTKIGSFKHIKYHTDQNKNTKKCIENLTDIKTLQKDDSITCMSWGNSDQTQIILGRKNRQVQIYKTDQAAFTKTYTVDVGEGEVVGVGRSNRRVLAAVRSGLVKVWSKKGDLEVDTGGKLDCMEICPEDPTLFATGGEENDLKIWQIGDLKPTFSAKNLPHDSLQLRRGVWVSGLCFPAGDKGNVVAVASRHGYVRLYDSRAQRRPVSCVDFDKMAATCIAPSFDERKFLVGFGRGQLHQVDLRMNKPDKGFKGCVGSVTSVQACLRTGLVVSTCLDRHIRVHCYNTKELLYKQYLTSKLTHVLIQNESSTPLVKGEEEIKDEEQEMEKDDMDELFDNMETVGGKSRKKKLLVEDEEKSLTEDVTEEQKIAQLLKSTERKKRKMDKLKKEKKSKSLFHNA